MATGLLVCPALITGHWRPLLHVIKRQHPTPLTVTTYIISSNSTCAWNILLLLLQPQPAELLGK